MSALPANQVAAASCRSWKTTAAGSRSHFASAFALVALLLANKARADERFIFEKAQMGVPFRITLYAPAETAAKNAVEAAFERVEVLNSILSDYDSDSELSRLARTSGQGRAVPVSGDLWRVLDASQQLAERTGGAFDITIGPLVNLWRRTRRTRETPSAELLAEMRQRVGFKHLRLDRAGRAAELTVPEMRLDVGGIAKGYAADEALAVLRGRGLSRALVAASGDIVAGDPPPGERGWRVQIASLDEPGAPAPETLLLANAAVSTSGDAFQFVEIGGVRYSHIVDPRTGLGLTERRLVTVIAATGLTADGLDTAVSVLNPAEGVALVEATAGAAMRMVRQVGDAAEVTASSGWSSLPWQP